MRTIVLFIFLSPLISNLVYALEEKKQGHMPPPKSDFNTKNLLQEIIGAGFKKSILDTNYYSRVNNEAIKAFLLLGNAKLADKYLASDKLERIQMTNETANHRELLSKTKFTFDEIKFKPVKVNMDSNILVLEMHIPFRISLSFEALNNNKCFGILAEKPRRIDAGRTILDHYYLTKDRKLRGCANSREIFEVRKNDGILYLKEKDTTTLNLILKSDTELLDRITRNTNDYSISAEINNLRLERPSEWGFYKEKALNDFDWDCDLIRAFSKPILNEETSQQPDYFVTASRDEENNKVPLIAMGDLISLKIIDKNNEKIIGSYTLEKK